MDNACFTVNPDGLDALSARLGELVSAMAGMDVTVSMYNPLDLGPDTGVWQALEDFSGAWASNLARVGHDVADLRDRLAAASGAYRGTEAQITRAAAAPPGAAR